MSELPAGSVTFLFTDVEGSTKLIGKLGGKYRDAMHEHRSLLTNVVHGAGGVVYGVFGDAVSAVFTTSADAVGAAVTSQRSFEEVEWPEGARIRIRIGIHAGDAIADPDEYLGLDVHRTARICAAAHGGQVLLSGAAYEALGAAPHGVAFRDLGEHQLKGLPEPDRLYQLLITGLRNDFPALRLADEPPPTASPRGRTRELAASLQKAIKALPRARAVSLGVSALEFSDEVSPANRRRTLKRHR